MAGSQTRQNRSRASRLALSPGQPRAFTQLLKHLPSDTGMGFVLVQHLDPTHESKLAELLARATRMPVVEARNGMRVAPDHVYVIPPNRGLVMDDGRLKLTARGRGRELPVNTFLKSLAEERGRQAIGVIQSGTASRDVPARVAHGRPRISFCLTAPSILLKSNPPPG